VRNLKSRENDMEIIANTLIETPIEGFWGWRWCSALGMLLQESNFHLHPKAMTTMSK
jgi:hypothetical protein